MVGYAALREIISADTLASIPRTDHTAAAVLARFRALSVIKIVHARTQNFKGALLVFELGAFVLAGYDDTRREVRDAHRRSYFVDVLTACAA